MEATCQAHISRSIVSAHSRNTGGTVLRVERQGLESTPTHPCCSGLPPSPPHQCPAGASFPPRQPSPGNVCMKPRPFLSSAKDRVGPASALAGARDRRDKDLWECTGLAREGVRGTQAAQGAGSSPMATAP